MHPILAALILGIVQGLTEFLPISSSGHLALAQKHDWFKIFADTQTGRMFDGAVHLGTLIALLICLWPDVVRVFRRGDEYHHLLWPIAGGAVAFLPVAIPFWFLSKGWLGGSYATAGLIILFGLVLGAADWQGKRRPKRQASEARWADVLAMSMLQGIALIPGISRSGITITTGLFRGLTREAAARISFLISVPAILISLVVAVAELVHQHALPQSSDWAIFGVGIVAAAISGFGAIRFLLWLLKGSSYLWFTGYRVAIGCLALWLIWRHTLER